MPLHLILPRWQYSLARILAVLKILVSMILQKNYRIQLLSFSVTDQGPSLIFWIFEILLLDFETISNLLVYHIAVFGALKFSVINLTIQGCLQSLILNCSFCFTHLDSWHFELIFIDSTYLDLVKSTLILSACLLRYYHASTWSNCFLEHGFFLETYLTRYL